MIFIVGQVAMDRGGKIVGTGELFVPEALVEVEAIAILPESK